MKLQVAFLLALVVVAALAADAPQDDDKVTEKRGLYGFGYGGYGGGYGGFGYGGYQRFGYPGYYGGYYPGFYRGFGYGGFY